MRLNLRDLGAGIFFLAVGLLYFVYTFFGYSFLGLRALPIGKALQMGPGYFPIVLSSIMVLIGVTVLARSVISGEELDFGTIPWRAIVMITASIAFFGFFLRELGLLPTVFATSLLACLSSDQIKLPSAAMVSAGMAVFCTAVFSYGVKLTIPIFGSWFDPVLDILRSRFV